MTNLGPVATGRPSGRARRARSRPGRLSRQADPLIVGLAAGGPTDIVARMLPRGSSNPRPAGRGREQARRHRQHRHRYGRRAKPDGYTILLGASTMALAPALYGKQLGYDLVNAFEAIAYVASVPLIGCSRPMAPSRSPRWSHLLRKETGKHSYPSSGNGGIIHLAGFLFAQKRGRRRPACALSRLRAWHGRPIAGRRLPGGHARHQQGLSRGRQAPGAGGRSPTTAGPQLPDVPTVQEALGFKISINTWYAAHAPRGRRGRSSTGSTRPSTRC